ncbi:glycosyltransferase family 4 protein [Lichenicoccus sp.]|uniref:glycosyltransferase family 4 protein n=1 Tax=Lichenicoccus sp. TaxID=2781899 RepID=UPI003D114CEF
MPRRVLMTVDGVGGVWRYALDLAHGLAGRNVACRLLGLGPRSDADPEGVDLVWTDLALDWLTEDEAALDGIAARLAAEARVFDADLLHLNVASQAAGLTRTLPVVVVAHSCVPTWWRAVKDSPWPSAWAWQPRRNRDGLDRADATVAPSASHAAALAAVYGPLEGLHVVYNATDAASCDAPKQPFVLAAGRWWDEGKDAATLDRAAHASVWPVRMAGARRGPSGETVVTAHAEALGSLPPERLRALMQEAAIFVSTSRYEPFGLAVLEAASHHAALVLADIPSFRELWREAALFVPPGHADGFADAIATLAGDPGLRRRLALAAGAIAREFAPVRHLNGVLAAYDAATARHRARG